MENRFRRKMTLGQDGNTLVLLLAILATVFCLFKFIQVGFYLSGVATTDYYDNIFTWFSLPADLSTLVRRPWTIITYMFMHDGVWHMLGNVLWIWCFGYILQDLTGNGKLIPLFLYGGLAGAVLFLLSYNIFPGLAAQATLSTVVGASAGAMAIAIATTVLAPGYRIFPMINGGIPFVGTHPCICYY